MDVGNVTVAMMESSERPCLRLVWSNPNPPATLPKPARIDLARAIERHLAGLDGLTIDQFLGYYSGRTQLGPAGSTR